jgi:Ca2+-binding RTX toxin-like protein
MPVILLILKRPLSGDQGSINETVAIGLSLDPGRARRRSVTKSCVFGNSANNVIDGRGGGDVLTGGAGFDTFAFNSAGDETDTITGLAAGAGGDAVDVSAVLTGFSAGNEANFVQLSDSGMNTTVRVDTNGGADSLVDLVTLQDVTGIDLATLLTDDNIVVT